MQLDPILHAVLENCRIALKALADQHADLADHSDMDLDGDTRWAARWRLATAAIAYANALVDLTDDGYTDTALPTSRALYEALGVLGVVNDTKEQTILDRWLEDREIQPKKVRAAAERQAKRIAEDAPASGDRGEGIRRLACRDHVRRQFCLGGTVVGRFLLGVFAHRSILRRHGDRA